MTPSLWKRVISAGRKVKIERVTRKMAMEFTRAKFRRNSVVESVSTRNPQQVVAFAVMIALPTWPMVARRAAFPSVPDSRSRW